MALEIFKMRLLASEPEQNTSTKTVPLPNWKEKIVATQKPLKFKADEIEIFVTEDKSTVAMNPYVNGKKKRGEIARDDDGREVHMLFDVTARWIDGVSKGANQKVTLRFDRVAEFEAGDVLVSDDDVVTYVPSGRTTEGSTFVDLSATLDSEAGWSTDRNMWADEDIDDYTGSKSDYSGV